MSKLILVLGGARSGKSKFAEQIVTKLGGENVVYVATAEAKDEEMADRINHHQNSRPRSWETIEEPYCVSKALKELTKGTVVLIDCLTLLVSNLLLDEDKTDKDKAVAGADKENKVIQEIEEMINQSKENDLQVVMVSNEVGQGLVPVYELGRVYRDIVGRVNQAVAKEADEVYITYAGLPVEIKELSKDIYYKWDLSNKKQDNE